MFNAFRFVSTKKSDPVIAVPYHFHVAVQRSLCLNTGFHRAADFI